MTAKLDIDAVRQDFPILSTEVYGKPLVYLDNAASAQKPKQVIDTMTEVMHSGYANVHRGLHYLSNKATDGFEAARESARVFLNAPKVEDIIFTSGATDAINLVSYSYLAPRIQEGDEIILSVMEHHSNIVPWHYLREEKGAVLKWVPVRDDGELDFEAYLDLLSPKTKMVALTQMSNALGTITPMKRIIAAAHDMNVPVLVDGCQGAVHLVTDVQDLDADFYVFSGHKVYGPSGIGVLYGKTELLAQMRPYRGGGEMIREVSLDNVTYGDAPHRFEAGTPPIVEAIGLGAALQYMMETGREAMVAHENELLAYATELMSEINSLQFYGTAADKGSILSFGAEGVHPHDLATMIDRSGVAVRAGHHCAKPLMDRFGVPATARASFACYNTREEVEKLAEAVKKALTFFA
ncbi:MAG: cysteine desulfurase [Parvibaculales bacterium]